MKKLSILLAAFACIVAVSCNKDNENGGGSSIVGEWSGIRGIEDKGNNDAVRVHINIKADGTYEQIMPAWIQKRTGTYTVKDNVITFKVNSLEWLWDRGNGYKNAYDERGCWFVNDDWEKPEKEREVYKDPMAQFRKENPDESDYSEKFKIDSDGNLTFETISGAGVGSGLQLIYYKNPGYKVRMPE